MFCIVSDQCMTFTGYGIIVRQGNIHRGSPPDKVSSRNKAEIRSTVWTFDADQKADCRINTDFLFHHSDCFAAVEGSRSCCTRIARKGSHCLADIYCSHRFSDPCIVLAIRTALKSCFIIEMTIITLLHRVLLVFQRKMRLHGTLRCGLRQAGIFRFAVSFVTFSLRTGRSSGYAVCAPKRRKMRVGAGAPGGKIGRNVD